MNQLIIDKLRELKPTLQEKYGIEEFAVFGSVAKGTDSDVDIAILKFDLKDAFDAKEFLSKSLEKPVDIGTFKSFIRNRIEKDFIYV